MLKTAATILWTALKLIGGFCLLLVACVISPTAGQQFAAQLFSPLGDD